MDSAGGRGGFAAAEALDERDVVLVRKLMSELAQSLLLDSELLNSHVIGLGDHLGPLGNDLIAVACLS